MFRLHPKQARRPLAASILRYAAVYQSTFETLAQSSAVSRIRALVEWRLDPTQSRASDVNRNLIITLAARHRLPAVYPFRYYVAGAA